MSSQLVRLLDAGYLGDIERRSMEQIRSMRAECQRVETGLSYLRRLVQGRLDIVGVELSRRAEGSSADLAELVARLPEILSEGSRPATMGRMLDANDAGEIDSELEDELADITTGHDVESLQGCSQSELEDLRTALEEFERKVSGHRRALFDQLDALQGEITRRYRTGEATVESLLK